VSETDRGLGRALKRAIGQEDILTHFDLQTSKSSVFMNKTRQDVFKLLCRQPCHHLRSLTRGLKLSATTTSWHTNKLVEQGLLASTDVGNRRVFYPRAMVPEKFVEPLHVLVQKRERAIFHLVRENPGIPQSKVVRSVNSYQQAVAWSLGRLEEVGLVVSNRTSQTTTYTTTDTRERMLEHFAKNQEAFLAWLVEALVADGVGPQLSTVRAHRATIRILVGNKKMNLNISTTPVTLLKA